MAENGRNEPLRVALTGGIATGKSYCLAKFADLGAATIDADVLAHQAVAPGTAGFEQVRSRFGESIVSIDGRLDQKSLARIVFADANARRALEAIVHPAVYGAIRRWLNDLRGSETRRIAVADIPLLFETGRQGDFDKVIVTSCPPELQLERLMRRSGLERDEAARRIAAQLPTADKVGQADYVIDTSGTFEETERQVRDVWGNLATSPSPPPACS